MYVTYFIEAYWKVGHAANETDFVLALGHTNEQ